MEIHKCWVILPQAPTKFLMYTTCDIFMVCLYILQKYTHKKGGLYSAAGAYKVQRHTQIWNVYELIRKSSNCLPKRCQLYRRRLTNSLCAHACIMFTDCSSFLQRMHEKGCVFCRRHSHTSTLVHMCVICMGRLYLSSKTPSCGRNRLSETGKNIFV